MDALGGGLVGSGPPEVRTESEISDDSSSSNSSDCSSSSSSSSSGGSSGSSGGVGGGGGDDESDRDERRREKEDDGGSEQQHVLAAQLQQDRLQQLELREQQGEIATLVAATAGPAVAAWPRRSTGWLTPLQAAQVRLLVAALPYAHFQCRPSPETEPALAELEPEPEPDEPRMQPELVAHEAAAVPPPLPPLLRDVDVAESIGQLISGQAPLCFTKAHWAIDKGNIPVVHPWRSPTTKPAATEVPLAAAACAGSPVVTMHDDESSIDQTGATAIVMEPIMVAGVHFCEFKLLSGTQMAFGVVRPTYEPAEADLPSEPDAQEVEAGGANGDWRQAVGGKLVSQARTAIVGSRRRRYRHRHRCRCRCRCLILLYACVDIIMCARQVLRTAA